MKFSRVLRSRLTTEWRSAYFDYDDAKAMLKDFIKRVLPSPGSDDFETVVSTFENDFFDFTQGQLEKANTFFLEKINEYKQKLAQLISNLNEFLEHQRKQERLKALRDTEARPSALGLSHGTFEDHRPHTSLNIHDFELAFSEFYLGLILLQNYHQLNLTAFRKILKKHDKWLATTKGARWREDVVLTSLFATCKDVDRMLEEVEREVTEKVQGGDRKRAMKCLRVPPLGQPHHSVWTVLRIGIWSGSLIILSLLIAFLIPWSLCEANSVGCWQDSCTPSNFTDPLAYNAPKFWEVTIRIYRGIFLLSLMIILLGINVHGWAASGVNHVLIFELDPRDHLSSLHLIEAGIALTAITSVSLGIWLCQFYVDYVFKINPLIIRYAALAYLLLVVLFLLNPLPIFMYRSRIWLLKVLFRIITAPFSEVRFADFWLADQFTSLVPVFQDAVFIICCCWIQFLPDDVERDCDRKLFILVNIIGCLPAWLRFLQCLRRFYDSGKKHPHLTNAGKYSTTFIVVLCRSLHGAWDNGILGPGTTTMAPVSSSEATVPPANANQSTTYPTTETTTPFLFNLHNPFLYCWIAAGTIGTLYTYLWDVKMDWGLLDCSAPRENRFLRTYIIFQHKWYYYAAIFFDLILRLSWTATVADIQISNEKYLTDIFITSLTFVEMFRRFIWNFFRLENEHVNNAGEFRAIRDISIKPIHADEFDHLAKRQVSKQEHKMAKSQKDHLIPKKSYPNRFSNALRNCWRRLTGRSTANSEVPAVYYDSYGSNASLIEGGNQNATMKTPARRPFPRTSDFDLSVQLLESFYVSRRDRKSSVVTKGK